MADAIRGASTTPSLPPRVLAGLERRRAKHGSVAILPRSSFSTNESYPMWVLPYAAAMAAERLRPHQELRRDELLVRYDSTMRGRVIFVSHQWLGWSHPDPNDTHWAALKATLRRLASGEAGDVEANWAAQLTYGDKTKVTAAEWSASLPGSYIWIDFASMPQPGFERNIAAAAAEEESTEGSGASWSGGDHRYKQNKTAQDLAKAVESIPSYVERSALVLVLAPPATHADTGKACDFGAWRGRGWCQMEFMAAFLKAETKPTLVTKGPDFTPEFILPQDALILLAGEGEFTCCARNHDFGNGPVPCDKLKVRAVLEAMLDTKTAYLYAAGKRLEARLFAAMAPHVYLRGLPPPAAEAEGGREERGGGAAAAAAAADEDDEAVGRAALVALERRLKWRGDGEDGEGAAAEAAWVAKQAGVGRLFFAVAADDAAGVDALLRLRRRKDGGGAQRRRAEERLRKRVHGLNRGMTPLMVAMGVASWRVVAALLDAGADPRARDDDTGADAVMWAALGGRAENLRAWLARFPRWDLDGRRDRVTGGNALHSCTAFGPNQAPTVRLLLEAKADPRARNGVGSTPLMCAIANVDADLDVVRQLLAATDHAHLNYQMRIPWGAPALLCAGARLATRCGARSQLAHMLAGTKGNTALHWAAREGNVEACALLLAAKADPARRLALWGLTPLEVARWRASGRRRGGRATAPIEALLGGV